VLFLEWACCSPGSAEYWYASPSLWLLQLFPPISPCRRPQHHTDLYYTAPSPACHHTTNFHPSVFHMRTRARTHAHTHTHTHTHTHIHIYIQSTLYRKENAVITLKQRFSIPVIVHTLCIFCMSLFVNKPDSDNQLVRSALHAWTVFRLTCSLHRVNCSLLPEQGKSAEVYFISEHSFVDLDWTG